MDTADKVVNPVMSDRDANQEKAAPGRNVKLRQVLPRTVCHGLVIFSLGITVAMRGPSFIDLQLISGTDVETGSFYFTANAFGYIIGALCTGAIYSRVKAKYLLVCVPGILSAILFAAIPWCVDFWAMLAIHAAVAFFWASMETTVNTEEVKGWEGNSYSAMQFLSFAYSLGGIIGPLIVEPFLAPKSSAATSNMSSGHHLTFNHSLTNQNVSAATNVSSDFGDVAMFVINSSLVSLHHSHVNNSVSLNMGLNNVHNSSHENYNLGETFTAQSSVHYGYFIAGVVIVLCSVPLCVLQVWTRSTKDKQKLEDAPKEIRQGKLPMKMYILLTGIISMFYFFYTTVDDPYSMYLSIFVVSHLNWSKEDGAIVSSLYWSCSTATKLAMIILVRYINPSVMLFVSCLGMVVIMTVLTICGHFHVHFMMWVCTALMAVSQSAVFGGGFAWADANLLKFDGRVTSSAMICASLGVMLDPMLLGVTMKEFSPLAFPYLLTFQAFITFCIFLVMLLGFKPYVYRKYGPPRADSLDIQVAEEEDKLCQDVDIKHSNLTDHTSCS